MAHLSILLCVPAHSAQALQWQPLLNCSAPPPVPWLLLLPLGDPRRQQQQQQAACLLFLLVLQFLLHLETPSCPQQQLGAS